MTPFLWSLPDSTKFGAEIGILNTQEPLITSSRSVLYFSGVFCPNYLLKYFGWLIFVLDKWIFSTITSISFPYPAGWLWERQRSWSRRRREGRPKGFHRNTEVPTENSGILKNLVLHTQAGIEIKVLSKYCWIIRPLHHFSWAESSGF